MLFRPPRFLAALLIGTLFAALAATGPVQAQMAVPSVPPDAERALVIDVIDGDTIRVDLGGGASERVRYIGIDTPEVAHQPDETDEPWGPEATEANEALVGGRFVLLERDTSETDRYGRLLRYVWVDTPDGWVMVNGELVAMGFAAVRAYEPDTRHDAWLRQLEADARELGLGRHGRGPADGVDETDGLLERILDLIFGG